MSCRPKQGSSKQPHAGPAEAFRVQRENQIKNELLLYNVSERYACYDRDLRIIWASRAQANQVESAIQASSGQYCFEIWHQRTKPCEGCPVIQARETKVPQESVLELPDDRLWRMRGYPILNEDGEVIALLEYGIDITDQKQTEASLEASEDKYRAIFNSVNDAIMIHDLKTGRPLEMNQKMVELLGYEVNELKNMQVAEWSAGDPVFFQNEAIRRINMAAAGEPQLFEWHIKCKNGDTKWTEVNLKAADVSGQKYVLAVVREITDRKRVEENLLVSEHLLNQTQKISNVGSYSLDIQSNRIRWSNQSYVIFGYQPGEIEPDLELVKRHIHPDDLDRFLAANEACFSGMGNYDETYRIIRNDGSVVTVHSQAYLEYDASGKPIRTFGALQDITEIKRLESQLMQARKMETIGTLTGGIAHDFNNILYMISGNAELALEDIPDWNPSYENIKEIKNAALLGAGIVKQLLNFSRRADPSLQPIGAITTIRDAFRFIRSMIPATVEMTKHLPTTEMTINGDPVQINQCLINICKNASQAMQKTGGVLRLSVDKWRLDNDGAADYTELAAGNYLRIKISDTGPGILQNTIHRIFDPYFTTQDVGKGSGMGLAIVLGIVKSHQGAVRVYSQPGKGTTFTLLFPIIEVSPVTEDDPRKTLPRGEESILFVDDEPAIAKMTGLSLERLGYAVETVTSPLDALDLFRAAPTRFDLVISDMTMPKINGIQLLEKIKEIRSDIPVIICTGHSSLINEKRAQALGIDAMVLKPIEKQRMAVMLRALLDKPLDTTEHSAG